MPTRRIAFLHLAPVVGAVKYNQEVLEKAIHPAAAGGAEWILTPELCTCGYYFAEIIGTNWIKPQPDPWMRRLMDVAKGRGLTIFLGHPERDAGTDQAFNTVFVIGPEGEILGRHRKISVVHKSEAWSSPGNALAPVDCGGIKVELVICSDAWRAEHAKALRKNGADMLVFPAAWAPVPHGPEGCWERASKEEGIPVWVCNRAGKEKRLDYTRAESVVAEHGKRVLEASPNGATLLLFDADRRTMHALSTAFEIVPL